MCCVIFPAVVHKTTGQVMSEFRSVRFWLVFSFRIGNISAACISSWAGTCACQPVSLQAFHVGEIPSPLSFRFGGIGCSFSAVAYKPSLSRILSVQWPISPHCRPTPEKGFPLHIRFLFATAMETATDRILGENSVRRPSFAGLTM